MTFADKIAPCVEDLSKIDQMITKLTATGNMFLKSNQVKQIKVSDTMGHGTLTRMVNPSKPLVVLKHVCCDELIIRLITPTVRVAFFPRCPLQ